MTATGKSLISPAGVDLPRWSRDGKEIFYLVADNRLMAVPVKMVDPRVDVGSPRTLRNAAKLGLRYSYDVSSDGQRFLVNTLAQASSATILTVNWPALVSRK